MNLSFDNPKAFSFVQEHDGSVRVSFPSACASLHLNAEYAEALKEELSRFIKETLTHTQYVLKRFKVQHTFLASYIQTLIHEGYWAHSGFTELGLELKNTRFKFETENFLEFMAAAFCFSKQLNGFMEDLPIKADPQKALTQWPSIAAVVSLPRFDESEYKGDWDVPLRFTSSGTLAGLVKPVIFHDGSIDIALFGGKVKLHINGDDAFHLLEDTLSPDDLSDFKIAKQAWSGLAELESGVRRFINSLKENGYNSDFDSFEDDNLNISGVHTALLELDNGLASEAEMKALNDLHK